jgi:hypothetical protein
MRFIFFKYEQFSYRSDNVKRQLYVKKDYVNTINVNSQILNFVIKSVIRWIDE